MLVKYIVDEDFINYKLPSMFIGCHSCTFKCGETLCQNSPLANQPDIEISIYNLVSRYMSNPITSAVVFGGLEPFDDVENVLFFIKQLRKFGCHDDVVIYTGYTEEEIKKQFHKPLNQLNRLVAFGYGNIIIKYGRYVPDQKPHYDEVLGVKLSSDNQYAKQL